MLNFFTVSGGSTGDVFGSIEGFLVIFDFSGKIKQDEEISFSKSVKRLFLKFSLSFSFSWFVTAGEKSKYSLLSDLGSV